jgi:hypothetical protein
LIEVIVSAVGLSGSILYAAVMTGRKLGRIEGSLERMDGHLSELSSTVRADHDRIDCHEIRLSVLESQR